MMRIILMTSSEGDLIDTRVVGFVKKKLNGARGRSRIVCVERSISLDIRV